MLVDYFFHRRFEDLLWSVKEKVRRSESILEPSTLAEWKWPKWKWKWRNAPLLSLQTLTGTASIKGQGLEL
ncbi:hypothetical protein IC582_001619 [Cucumis melo]